MSDPHRWWIDLRFFYSQLAHAGAEGGRIDVQDHGRAFGAFDAPAGFLQDFPVQCIEVVSIANQLQASFTRVTPVQQIEEILRRLLQRHSFWM